MTGLYLKSEGWNVSFSKGSRGPADVIASRNHKLWLIQVKASRRLSKLKGCEVTRLMEMASKSGGMPVVATLQPQASKAASFDTGNFALSFYLLDEWTPLDPT